MEKVLIVPIVTKQTSRFSKYRLVRRRAQPGWKIQLKLNLMVNAELLRFCRKLSPPGWVANCKRQHRSKGTNSIVVFQKQFVKGIFSKIETIIDDRDISLTGWTCNCYREQINQRFVGKMRFCQTPTGLCLNNRSKMSSPQVGRFRFLKTLTLIVTSMRE